MKVILIAIIGAIITLFLIGIVFYFIDKHIYNNGICRKCGSTVKCFDVDSQGGLGYACDKCEHYFWLCWYRPKDDNKI